MKKLSAVALVLGLSVLSTASFASGHSKNCNKPHKWFPSKSHSHSVKKAVAVPEINAAGSAMGFALAGGLLLVARERRRNRQS